MRKFGGEKCTRGPSLAAKIMKNSTQTGKIKDGDKCVVLGGTHKGKSGVVRDIKTSKTGHITITVVQANTVRFKTLAKNVSIKN
jgi:ribosomal protein S4E